METSELVLRLADEVSVRFMRRTVRDRTALNSETWFVLGRHDHSGNYDLFQAVKSEVSRRGGYASQASRRKAQAALKPFQPPLPF